MSSSGGGPLQPSGTNGTIGGKLDRANASINGGGGAAGGGGGNGGAGTGGIGGVGGGGGTGGVLKRGVVNGGVAKRKKGLKRL